MFIDKTIKVKMSTTTKALLKRENVIFVYNFKPFVELVVLFLIVSL